MERIVDKRKNKKGKWEYLIRWKGYGSNEDTWEPEHHLLHCEEFIDEFNGLHVTREKRSRHGKQASAPKFLRENRVSSVEKISHRPSESGKSKGSTHKRKRINASLQKQKRGYAAKPASANDRAAKTVTYRTTPSGLQIMPLKKPHNGLQNGDGSHEKDSRHFGNGSQQQNMDLNDHEGEQNLPSMLEVSNDSPVVNGIGMWFKLVFFLQRGAVRWVVCSNCKQRVHLWKNHCHTTQVIWWEAHNPSFMLFPHILYHFLISWLLSFHFSWSSMKQCGLCYVPLQCRVLVGKWWWGTE